MSFVLCIGRSVESADLMFEICLARVYILAQAKPAMKCVLFFFVWKNLVYAIVVGVHS